MSDQSRAFALGDVLSVTTGRLVSPSGIVGVYDILNFMTRDKLYTHQLPRACRECAPWLLRQHPQLAAVVGAEVTPENWREWIAAQVEQFGKELAIEPIPHDDHTYRDPLEELQEMAGDKPIIQVDIQS